MLRTNFKKKNKEKKRRGSKTELLKFMRLKL